MVAARGDREGTKMADDLKTGDRMARAAMTTEPMAKKIAERYLASRGYEILARDWRCGGERVDIVARDGDVAVLVDVAAGGGELGGEFAEVEAAADRLVRAAELFCNRFDVERGACRIDCLRFRLRDGGLATIKHYLGARGVEPAC